MKIGELAFKIHVHRIHAWRLASAGIIPGTRKTEGGHFYFVKSRQLTRWINFMKSGGAFRKKELSRAYQRGYGKVTPALKKEEKEHWHWFKYHQKQAAETRREFRGYQNMYSDLFEEFFYDTDDLIRILDELVGWRPQKLKSQMIKSSSKRLTMLRDLINLWLISENLTIHDIAKLRQQQSSRT